MRKDGLVRFWGRLSARLVLIIVLFASGVAYEAPQLFLAALAVGVSAALLSLKRYRKHVLGKSGRDVGSRRELEARLVAVEDLQERRGMDFEDQYHGRLAELEERLDFTERLLASQNQAESERYPTPV